MGVKEFFNKAAKGVKTLFKKDGTLETVFKKGGQFIDKTLSGTSNLAQKVGGISQALAPALSMINPSLGAAAMGVGAIANRADQFSSNLAATKKELTDKISPILLPKPQEEMMAETVNFA
jgi:hypothetical protein